jgi:DNA helicase-2/ATP-dependent DNA helicase PcrA
MSPQSRKALRLLTDLSQLLPALERWRSSDEVLDGNWERLAALAAKCRDVATFLDRISLEMPEDAYVAKAEKVALLTLHAAKGLEFPVVFIVGCEDGLLPLEADFLETDVGEERRLFYVGMTRARERLYFTRAGKRRLFGRSCSLESPFGAMGQRSAGDSPAQRGSSQTGRMREAGLSPFVKDIRAVLETVRPPEISRRKQQEREQMKLF